MAQNSRADIRRAVHSRIRKKVRGTAERPRLAIFRSVNHIYAQIIDDASGKTLASASTTQKDLGITSGGNIEAAKKVGQTIAERALAAGVSQVVFDRGGYVYHGRVKALLDATREAGLNKNNNASEEPSIIESVTDTVSSAVGSVAGMIADAVDNVVGGSEKKPSKSSRKDSSEKTGERKADANRTSKTRNK